MKKLILAVTALGLFTFACTANKTDEEATTATDSTMMVDSIHNSKSSLDWDGTYEGTLPCADCDGIKTVIELKKDQTFVKNEEYLGKKDSKFSEKGKIEWDANGNDVKLISTEGDTLVYKVKEDIISQLDVNGKEVTGEMARFYDFHKK